ncbi:MAG: GIY-YIG nuclease family protein [Caulobacteraceae bacterium]|nr:GIY-YIG nuclease family protein [Caulobacteraceae bacterium]
MMASQANGTLYIGVTNDLSRRVFEHKSSAVKGFTSRYGVKRLVWYRPHDLIVEAIAEEKRLKKLRRDEKIALIEAMNPQWYDLYLSLNR